MKMAIIPKSNVTTTKRAETLEKFLEFVGGNSPFYREFWNTIFSAPTSLESYPLTDHAAYWLANTCLNSKVVTSEQQDGIIFKTGGNPTRLPCVASGHSRNTAVRLRITG